MPEARSGMGGPALLYSVFGDSGAMLLPLRRLPRHPIHDAPQRKPSGILSAVVSRRRCVGQYRLSFCGHRAGPRRCGVMSLQSAWRRLQGDSDDDSRVSRLGSVLFPRLTGKGKMVDKWSDKN